MKGNREMRGMREMKRGEGDVSLRDVRDTKGERREKKGLERGVV